MSPLSTEDPSAPGFTICDLAASVDLERLAELEQALREHKAASAAALAATPLALNKKISRAGQGLDAFS